MKITYTNIADYFIALSNDVGDTMTNLRLQKLVYYAQAWYLGNYSKPLFEEDFQAWVHGPVIPELYHEFSSNSYRPICKEITLEEVEKCFDKDTLDYLQECAEVYMPYTAYQLEAMSHIEAPWINARGELDPTEKCTTIITKESIQKYYGARLKEDYYIECFCLSCGNFWSKYSNIDSRDVYNINIKVNNNVNTNIFKPDYRVPPCETLNETLEYYKISQEEFSTMIGIELHIVKEVLSNKRKIDEKFATEFEKYDMGASSECE